MAYSHILITVKILFYQFHIEKGKGTNIFFSFGFATMVNNKFDLRSSKHFIIFTKTKIES